ncbi:MAG TPA: right-handed parallel beta-helix repeat-containing protein [Thermoanaerobaculia bacterium]|nr:right-handed parallel beta-helix repeat-containing protein [Thermoanaerobaculia bacterium]
MPIPPAAFLSYVRFEDQHEEGRITQLKQRLEGEVRVHTGWREFKIFQDRADIHWGQEWKARLDEAIEAVTFFIPILTPLYFRSEPCRAELEQFLARERELGRRDLVLPIYYVDAPILNDPARLERDSLAAAVAARQYQDWREIRFEPLTDPRLAKTLAGMAIQIRDALERSQATAPQSPEPKTGRPIEPATHIVDARQRGDFTTLSAAIEAARPGDRILVRPGLYKENLVIEKPLEILGDGVLEEIEVQAAGEPALLFRAATGRVSHLTLRQIGGGNGYGVEIASGQLALEDCDISSLSATGVDINHGVGRLCRNRIHDSWGNGVTIARNGYGILEDNEIVRNHGDGVGIFGNSNATLRRNKIASNKNWGISVVSESRGTFEGNDLRGNTYGAWGIARACRPNVIRKDNLEK